jgi:hypothetical protein
MRPQCNTATIYLFLMGGLGSNKKLNVQFFTNMKIFVSRCVQLTSTVYMRLIRKPGWCLITILRPRGHNQCRAIGAITKDLGATTNVGL